MGHMNGMLRHRIEYFVLSLEAAQLTQSVSDVLNINYLWIEGFQRKIFTYLKN